MNLKRLSGRIPADHRNVLAPRPTQPQQHKKPLATRRAPVSSRNQVAEAYASLYLPSPTSSQNDLFKKLSTIPGGLQLSSHVINKTASRIQAHWEGVQSGVSPQSARTVQLSSYISTILTRTSLAPVVSSALSTEFPSFSCVALVLSLIYVDRLKKMHPSAKGEAGCGLRLFLVSYMIASKYIQAHISSLSKSAQGSCDGSSPAIPLSSLISPNEHWARLSSIFSTPELTRMELEFLSFLQFDLFVSYEDFKYFWSMYMEINQTVPEESPSPVLEHFYGSEECMSDDASVPDM
ncbi:hypothetical protein K493DRAFT_356273 [Basidiobolus meristosporus CBS 931.73]|uniref:Cyclin N-terminal domain-containing protein n=1 Tax=Basidiobolus meristosporus CBS 931.73 TaxID=1314790 RepID=A0A1Y1XYS8_9FUNG|nr:hypothetical protein K493DRAFT_356273 [Basidiobolus meristosporus CBS 931.73]|eukprot:ORX90889.1 hypothetical protein K493DRAFT_356273 [Basidiobolus meristosporus CBS 931.73]